MALTKIQTEQIANDAVGSAHIADNIALGGSPTTTTQSASDNSTKVATTAYVDAAYTALVDSSPATLNTLNELAAALGDDANFSTTVTNSIATKLPLAGGTMTGNLTVNAIVDADNFKINNAQGSDGQVLTSTGSGVAWETPSSFNADAAQTFNDSGNDVDFRVESNDSANMIFVDGGENKVLIEANNTASVTDSASMVAASTLEINGDASEGSDILRIGAAADGTGSYWIEVSNSGGNAKYPIQLNPINKGAVIIGDTAANASAHANVDDLIVGNVASGSHGIQIKAHSGSNSAIFFGDQDSNLSGQLEYGHASDALYFITGGNQRARLDVHGLKFGSDSAAANALDDYEEGTWTPAFGQSGGGDGGTTYTYQYGFYTKIGNIVHCYIDVQHSQMWSWQGSYMYLTLPFTAASQNWYSGVTPWEVSTAFTATDRKFKGYVGPSTNQLRLYRSGTGNDSVTTMLWNQVGRISFSLTYTAA